MNTVEISALRNKVQKARKEYWEDGISFLSDEEYDRCVERLKELTGFEDGVFSPKVLSGGKVKHPEDRPMLSMQKVYSLEDVKKWYRSLRTNSGLWVMPKYDGIALRVYPDGTIATRGDGTVGENVTETAGFFVPSSDIGDGEAVCTVSRFETTFKAKGYKNPRNVVSGIMSAKDRNIQEMAVYLSFCKYENIRAYYPSVPDEDEIEKLKRGWNNIPTDGIVFRLSDEAEFLRLGHTDHHWRGQIALKPKNESAVTTVREIRWTENNGTVTPVAVFDPVMIGGAEIEKATLHNADRVAELDIRIGDEIRVERAGGVIPKVAGVVRRGNGDRTQVPSRCPSCHGALATLGKRLYCANCVPTVCECKTNEVKND